MAEPAVLKKDQAETLKAPQPPKLATWKKVVTFPLWLGVATIYFSGLLWFGICGMGWAARVNYVIDVATFGKFEVALTEFLNPKGGVPKEGMMKNLSEKMLNKKENYIHFASILYVACGVAGAWASILYMRMNDIGSWWGPLLVHLYFMGAFFIMGINDMHYVAHYQVSNNQKNHMFKSEMVNAFCRFVLEPGMGFIPEFWLNHHVLIHHKESNGPDDIQGVTFFERKLYNFIWFVADIPLQWYVRGVIHHFRNGNSKIAMEMIAGEVAYIAFGIAMTRWDAYAAALLVWIPHLIRSMNFNASNEYTQHALVDGRDGNPHDPANNSFLLLKPVPREKYPRGIRSLPDNFEERWHAVHHNFPLKGMSGQNLVAPKVKCNLIFDTDYLSFKNAVMSKNMIQLAEWWRPGYNFGNDNHKVSKYAEADKKLDIQGKAKLLESFLNPAYDLDEMGEWITAPPFPFNMMELGEQQEKVSAE